MTSASPAASVVVPSRGGVRRLPILLGGLHRQERDDFEVIIVLDGDIDRSRIAVERFIAAFGDRLRIVEFPENRGRVAALNAGFAEARGHVLIRCDDDLEPAPEFVDAHVETHQQNANAGVVGLYRNRFSDTRYARVYGRPRDVRFREEAYTRPVGESWVYWAGNSSVTRATYDRVGEYDADYSAYGWEDIDYGFRLRQAGVRVILAPAAETTHNAAAVTTRVRMKRAYYSGAARRLFDEKHPTALNGQAVEETRSSTLWEQLVALESTVLSTGTVEKAGAAIDCVIPFLPRYIAEKLVASGVEAASLAGQQTEQNLKRTF
ncbi:glycosyltransferase family 2 protein [Brevibacterium senegalense]|uniref:glycosyltransferase family 2 protein n=1 Tax=Brevibacterium senegalense TaxID=1033736 RepID=UPI0002D8478E|nr:glycosyltransferase [Brevibacterium senegalense]